VNGRRALTLVTLPLVLAAGVVGAHAALASTTAPAKSAQTCVLGIICLGGGSSSTASPAPTYSLPTCLPTALPTSLPTALPTAVLKKLKKLPRCLTSALPAKLPTSLPGAVGLPGTLPAVPGLPTSVPSLPGLPTGLPTAPGTAGSGPGNGTSSGKDPKAKSAAGGYGLVASAATSVITAGSATMVDFTYKGNAKVPTAAGRTVTMMKFTASSLVLSGRVADAVTEDGVTATTSSPVMAFNGNVVLYATRLAGTLDGVRLVFTPTTVSGLLLHAASVITSHGQITMTSVTTNQALGTADSLRYGPASFSVSLS
jgi:hypothetical protein